MPYRWAHPSLYSTQWLVVPSEMRFLAKCFRRWFVMHFVISKWVAVEENDSKRIFSNVNRNFLYMLLFSVKIPPRIFLKTICICNWRIEHFQTNRQLLLLRDVIKRQKQASTNELTLDRADNSKGYAASNLVKACWLCNYIKGAFLTESEMKQVGARLRKEMELGLDEHPLPWNQIWGRKTVLLLMLEKLALRKCHPHLERHRRSISALSRRVPSSFECNHIGTTIFSDCGFNTTGSNTCGIGRWSVLTMILIDGRNRKVKFIPSGLRCQ